MDKIVLPDNSTVSMAEMTLLHCRTAAGSLVPRLGEDVSQASVVTRPA